MVSVIIPACNEENIIERCLKVILSGSNEDELEVIVACNGCSDNTAVKARNFGEKVQVIEIEEASKTKALNAADQKARFFPRFYVDADVLLPLNSIRKIVSEMVNSNCLLSAPVVNAETSFSSFNVKAFYDVWQKLPYNKVMVGTGVYVLSKKGRERFTTFPEVISDDGFVRFKFTPEERFSIKNTEVIVFAPKTIKELITVKTRTRLGGYELKIKYPDIKLHNIKSLTEIINALPFSIMLPYKIFVYALVNIIARFRARLKLKNLQNYKWERDEMNRL